MINLRLFNPSWNVQESIVHCHPWPWPLPEQWTVHEASFYLTPHQLNTEEQACCNVACYGELCYNKLGHNGHSVNTDFFVGPLWTTMVPTESTLISMCDNTVIMISEQTFVYYKPVSQFQHYRQHWIQQINCAHDYDRDACVIITANSPIVTS